MKKVYTITFHRADNYGAMLQAYALQKVLEKKYNTEILDYDNEFISNPYRVFRKLRKNPIKSIYHILCDLRNYNVNSKRTKNFREFRKMLKLSKYFKNNNSLFEYCEENSVFIVGSDQIWNPKLTNGLDKIYFLNFNSNKMRRISYAASSCDIKYLKNEEEVLKKNLLKFDAISVREIELKDYLTSLTNREIKIVLDPTLILSKSDWDRLIMNNKLLNKKYIFAYSVGNDNELYYNTINNLIEKTGLEVVIFDKKIPKKKINGKVSSYYTSGPLEFVNLLNNAEYVVTTSFHGTALSIIFNKKMFVILSTLPDRIVTLLKTINLQDRIISSNNDFYKLYNSEINWDNINNLLLKEREKSIDWLFESIDGDK